MMQSKGQRMRRERPRRTAGAMLSPGRGERAPRRAYRRGVLSIALAAALFVAAMGLIVWGVMQGSRRGADVSSGASVDVDSWELTLVNADHPLPEDYDVETVEVRGGELVDVRIVEQLTNMFDAARRAGYDPFVRSGWRSRDDQEAILEERIQAYEDEGEAPDAARRQALEWVALPGTSEHELGLAVDINDHGDDAGLYDWLAQHAHEYGFILRYPENRSDVTGISHEPWHYRYVGVDSATEIWQRGIVLEEYLA